MHAVLLFGLLILLLAAVLAVLYFAYGLRALPGHLYDHRSHLRRIELGIEAIQLQAANMSDRVGSLEQWRAEHSKSEEEWRALFVKEREGLREDMRLLAQEREGLQEDMRLTREALQAVREHLATLVTQGVR